MASNRDPQKSYRINKRGRKVKVTSSATRAARSKKSTVPKPTSSSTRGGARSRSSKVTTGSGGNKPTLPQGPRQPPVQGPYQKPPKSMLGSRNAVPKKPTTKAPPTPGNKISSYKPKNNIRLTPRSGGKSSKGSGVKQTLLAGMATALATGALRNPVSKAKKKEAKKKASQVIDNYNTKDADGTVRSRKKVGPAKVGPKKVGPKKVGTEAQSFDKAFASARKAGKSVFTWKGKKYNTKTK